MEKLASDLLALKIETWLGFGVATLFTLIMCLRSRNNKKALGQRTESAGEVFFRQFMWAIIFFLLAWAALSINELHATAALFTMGGTMAIWGIVPFLFESRRQQVPTMRHK